MAISVKRNTVYAVEVETTEGTYQAPQSANSYVKTLTDGAEMNPSKERVARDIITGSIGKTPSRIGTSSASAQIPVEVCSGDPANGGIPEYDALMRSALGLRRSTPAVTIDATDSGQAHTVSRAYLADADAGTYNVGDIVTFEVAGDFHTSPITAVSDVAGDVYIDLLVAMAAAPADGTTIKASVTYVTSESGHPSLSITKYIEGVRREYVRGAKVTSMALENFSTGQIASFNFATDAIDFDASLNANPFTPDYQDCLPPIMLDACVFMDGNQIAVNDLDFTVENTTAFVTSTCSKTGRLSSRISERTITGSFNPYKQDDDVSIHDKFNCNEQFSLFATAHNNNCPDNGEYQEIVSFYIPHANITEIAEADSDGNLQEEISFEATRGTDSKSEEIYISFS